MVKKRIQSSGIERAEKHKPLAQIICLSYHEPDLHGVGLWLFPLAPSHLPAVPFWGTPPQIHRCGMPHRIRRLSMCSRSNS